MQISQYLKSRIHNNETLVAAIKWTVNAATLQENSLSNGFTPFDVAALTVPAQEFSLNCLRVTECHFEICVRLDFCSESLDPDDTDSKCSGRTTCLPKVSASGN